MYDQGKVILEASQQMAVEASYCMATGLHALPIDDSKGPMSPSGNLAVNMCHTVSFIAMMLLVGHLTCKKTCSTDL